MRDFWGYIYTFMRDILLCCIRSEGLNFTCIVNIVEKMGENLVYSDFLRTLAAQNVKCVRLWQK